MTNTVPTIADKINKIEKSKSIALTSLRENLFLILNEENLLKLKIRLNTLSTRSTVGIIIT